MGYVKKSDLQEVNLLLEIAKSEASKSNETIYTVINKAQEIIKGYL